MKTFKLKLLKVLNAGDKEINFPLLDGLIINQEDELDQNRWAIEAYLEKEHKVFFEKWGEKEISLLVKITRVENEPVVFRANIISVNDIGENINVLFKGEMIR
ncbi:YwpF family protein [Oceanobacillus senegalensis]|uniref:YwpF family protein n=1 Tax=Oceanobacillus senegalensis TaxID=1936063 RepID=UPI000A307A0A|nr:YwpF family protein [Oceanobacillus senegalensis]